MNIYLTLCILYNILYLFYEYFITFTLHKIECIRGSLAIGVNKNKFNFLRFKAKSQENVGFYRICFFNHFNAVFFPLPIQKIRFRISH